MRQYQGSPCAEPREEHPAVLLQAQQQVVCVAGCIRTCGVCVCGSVTRGRDGGVLAWEDSAQRREQSISEDARSKNKGSKQDASARAEHAQRISTSRGGRATVGREPGGITELHRRSRQLLFILLSNNRSVCDCQRHLGLRWP